MHILIKKNEFYIYLKITITMIYKHFLIYFFINILYILVYATDVYDINGNIVHYGNNIYINADKNGFWSVEDGYYIKFIASQTGASNFCVSDLTKDTCKGIDVLKVGDKFTLRDNSTGKSLCKRVGSGYIVSYDGSRNIEECTFTIILNSSGSYSIRMSDDRNLPVSQYSGYVFASTNYDPLELRITIRKDSKNNLYKSNIDQLKRNEL